MPGKQEIEFIIRPDGIVEEKVVGVGGPECEKITADIEQALGTVSHRERSTDYFNQGQTSEETLTTGH